MGDTALTGENDEVDRGLKNRPNPTIIFPTSTRFDFKIKILRKKPYAG